MYEERSVCIRVEKPHAILQDKINIDPSKSIEANNLSTSNKF